MSLEAPRPTSEVTPETLLDTPIPGVIYPERTFSQILDSLKSNNLVFDYFNSAGMTQVMNKDCTAKYFFYPDGRLSAVSVDGECRERYFYDNQGRLTGKYFESFHSEPEEGEQIIDREKFTLYAYDSKNSLQFTVVPQRFNDGICP